MNSPHPETVCVEAGGDHTPGEPVSPVVHLSTTYHHGGDYEYIREASPTIEAFERVLGSLEGGHAVAFSSGMAASAAVLDGLAPGALGSMMESCDRRRLARIALKKVAADRQGGRGER